jgi:uncharacterized repeat protein (TIGR01451 family)
MGGTSLKKLSLFLTVGMLAALLTLITAGSASASTTWTVCASSCNFTTIQEAVTAASDGDTIQVGAGNYPSTGNTQIILDKQLTLDGAQAGVDARTRGPGGLSGLETVMPATNGPYVFYLAADNITIDGFMFPDMGPRGFDTYENVDHLTVRNNIFESTTGNSQGGNIQFGGGGTLHANYFDFEQNYVQNGGGGNMIYMGHAMDNGTIRDNYINGDNFAFGPFGVRTGWLIEGNEFNGNVPGSGPYSGYGINANLGDVVIRNNNVHQMVVGLGQISVVGGSITGNTFNDNSFAAFQLWGGEFGSVVSGNVQIANNLIKYNGTACAGFADASHGIRLRTGLDASTIHLHSNNFVDLGVGACPGPAWAIRQNGTGAADATLNYWGTPVTAASIAAKIGQGTADVSPWIAAYNDNPAHAGELGFWPLVTTKTTITSDTPDPSPVNSAYTVSGTVEPIGLDGVTTNLAVQPGKVVVSDGTDTCTDNSLTDSGTLNKYAFSCSLTSTTLGAKTLTATYSDTSAEPFYDTSSGTTTHDVAHSADLSVSKLDTPDPAHVGQKLTYTIGVTNNGPDGATSVSLNDPLPKNTGNGSVSTTQGSCTLSKKMVVHCALGDLANAHTATVTINVKPTVKGTITNTVTVSATTLDPDTLNNTAKATTTVNP